MKPVVTLLFSIFICAVYSYGQNHVHRTPTRVGCLDYWQEKLDDPDFNYFTFKAEFDQYWKGKTPVKGDGHKQVQRWLDYKGGYLNPDGSLRTAYDDLSAAMNYNSSRSSQSITGYWTYAGPWAPVYVGNTPSEVAMSMGRISAIGFDPSNPNIIYAGAPLGGLWKSHNSGASWQALNTDNIEALGVSAIAVDPSNPDIIYIGTGDRDKGLTSGIGIYKSVDGGNSWTGLPLDQDSDKKVCKIFIHPDNSNQLIVGCNSGIYYSENGGLSWAKKINDNIFDMDIRPGSDSIIYAVSKNRLFLSFNFGKIWIPRNTFSTDRIALGVSADNPLAVYLFTSKNSDFAGILYSDDGGWNFSSIPSTGISNEAQGGYNLDMVVDPLDHTILYGGMVNFYKSTNGGVTWINQQVVSADDQHIFEFHPVTHRLFIGNDSGIWYTDDGENYYYSSIGLNVAEIRWIDVDAQNPSRIIAGLQDGATFITEGGSFYRVHGGDGMTCKFDQTDDNYVYASGQEGSMVRSTNGGATYPAYQYYAGQANGINQPGNWQSAYLLDYTNPNRMFAGKQDIWRSTNVKTPDPLNVTWTNISNGAFGSCTIEFIEQSKPDPNTLYVFTDHQTIFRSTNALSTSPTWTQLSNPGLNFDVRLEAHPTNANVVYMTSGTKIYKSTQRGTNWVEISGSLPGFGLRSLAYMEGSPEGIYLGTTAGVYYKDSTMTDWVPFKSGIPLTSVYDLVINYSTNPPQLFAATFGRGIWKTTVLTVYEPDVIVQSGSATVSGTTVSTTNSYQTSESMVTIPSLSFGYYLSTNRLITSTDYIIGTRLQQQVGPGSQLQANLLPTDVATILPEIPPGTYYIGMIADYLDQVEETDEENNVWASDNTVTIPAAPPAPTSVNATDGSFTDRTTITWVNSSGESLYFAVYRATLNTTSLAVKISPDTWISGTTFDDTTGLPGKTYYYWVRSSRYSSGIRVSEFSSSNSGWRMISPPEYVDATDGQYSDKITITWPSCEGATHYRVYRNTTPIATELMYISGLLWISDTSFTDLSASNGTTYYYWVRSAKNEFGGSASAWSGSDTGWEGFTSAPDAIATDGTYTDRVEISWNSVPGASYYRLYRGTSRYSIGATALSNWQTGLTFSDATAATGTIYYYWVKAANNSSGTNSTGFGMNDTGFRNYLPPTGLTASDGSSTSYIQLLWNSSAGATYYRLYRSTSNSPCECPVTPWQTSRKYNDSEVVPGVIYYYWVKAAGDTNVTVTNYSTSNDGYRKISAPAVVASTGIYTDKVIITWEPAEGATYYRITRAQVNNPGIQTVLSNWSNGLNNTFTDLTAELGQEYYFRVTGAVSATGLRAGNTGADVGYADACGNLTDVESNRSINFHGTTLELSQRVINSGPFTLTNTSQVAIYLEDAIPNGTPEAFLGVISIPPLEPGQYYDYNFSVDLDTISGFNFTPGLWHVAFNLSYDDQNCNSNPDDDYLIWMNPGFTYTDALHGIYTVGNVSGDFYDIAKAVEALHERGISDPVTFLIAPGTYPDKLVFSSITGVSPSKRITFRSENFSQMATLIAQPYDLENYTVLFDNAAYITFLGLKLTTYGHSDFQSTFGRVIHIGGTSHDLNFENNIIEGFSDPSHISHNNAVIYGNTLGASNIQFSANVIRYGAMGIYLAGYDMNDHAMSGTLIDRNLITGFLQKGIVLSNQIHPIIFGNNINQTEINTDNSRGIELLNSRGGFEINLNSLTLEASGFPSYGIMVNNVNLDGIQDGLISNNFISIGSEDASVYGLYINDIHKTRILYNSVHITGQGTSISSSLVADCNPTLFNYDNSLINNILSNRMGGYCIVYNDNPSMFGFFSESDYNNMITAGTIMALFKDTPITSLAIWRSATGFDTHSLSVDPEFVSDTDLHSTSANLNEAGIPRSETNIDIDGEPRSLLRPDIGADEFSPPPPSKTLNLSVFLEGLYTGPNLMAQAQDENGPHFGTGIADKITVELHQSGNYSTILFTASNVNLNTIGQAIITIPGTFTSSYYITVKHRNSIEITTASPVSFAASTITYAFNHPTKVFGGNILLKPGGNYVVYGGDVNQDGLVDSSDMIEVDNDASEFAAGYLVTDTNGDGLVDSTDMILVDNNAGNFISAVLP